MSNQFAPYQQQAAFPQEPRQSGSGCLWGILIGCLGTVVVCGLLCAGAVWYVQNNAGKWVAGIARQAIVATINGSEIPDAEKTEVIAQVDRVINDYKAGKINEEDLTRLMEEFQSSPAFLLISAWGLEKAYLEPSGLPEEEKTQGRRTIQRAFRGLCEKKITQEQFQAVAPQFEQGAQLDIEDDGPVVKNNPGQPDKLTDEQVQTMLADLKKLADDAGIPDEPFEIDIGDEVKKTVDQALLLPD
jgi:hypothetical protein